MREILGSGRFLRLVSVDGWEWVERVRASGVVAVVAVTPDRRLVLTVQHRPALGRTVIDLPAGLAGDGAAADEPAIAAAARELAEETGWEAERFTPLADCPTSPGLTSEVVTLVRAHGLRRTGDGGGVEGEAIAVATPTLAEAPAWLAARAAAGDAIDLKVWAGLWFAQRGDG